MPIATTIIADFVPQLENAKVNEMNKINNNAESENSDLTRSIRNIFDSIEQMMLEIDQHIQKP